MGGGAADRESRRQRGVVAESTLLSDRVAVKFGPGIEAGSKDKFYPLQNVPRPVLQIDTVAVA